MSETGSEKAVITETSGAVATITLNRPKAFNAFNNAVRTTLLAAVRELEGNDKVRVVIIRGNGPGFSAGADLADGFPDPISKQIEEEYKPFLLGIAQSDKIYIAQIHGTAAGIGAALALTCDLVTMADDASIYLAFAGVALIPDGGLTWHLLRTMGYAHALAAALEGAKLHAPDCVQYGMANKVFPKDQLESETAAWAAKLSTSGPLAMAAAKRLLRQVGRETLSTAITIEGLEQDHLTRSKDCQRGIDAFRARTKPVFEGN